ncbi:RNA polymerase subunit sigma-70, partial [Mitsuaria sp. TWR114]|uniref:sigma factor-like helix-turn-helix DNA-binding protein n=2 Tax=Roseateles TaxID=93681 RepID=UPI0011C29947
MLKALRDREVGQEINASAVPEAELAEAEPFFDDGPDRELRDWVRHGLAALSLEQRTTVELAYCQGESCEEIARIMACPSGTVKARLVRAREKLKDVLPALAEAAVGTRGY